MNIEINKQAPIIIKDEIQIKATSEKVWSVLSDINNWKSWQKNVSYSKLNGELKPETIFNWKANGSNIQSKLHTVEPMHSIGWTGKSTGLSVIHNWELLDNNGNTKVLVEESIEGWVCKLFKKLLKKILNKAMKTSLLFLKTECEKQSIDNI